MTARALNHETQALRAYIEAKKRDVRAAEQRYDVLVAATELQALALPLLSHQSAAFPASWKRLYVDAFYRDVASFLLGFVTVHLETCFSPQQRADAIDAFFDTTRVPATTVLDALTTTLTSTTLVKADASERGDARATIAQCVRLLERALDAGALEEVVTAMLAVEDQAPGGRGLVAYQPLVSSVCALPDLVHNRSERATPSCFTPRRYYPRLGESLFRALRAHYDDAIYDDAPHSVPSRVSSVFRLVVDKLVRIGQTRWLVQSWLAPTSALYDSRAARVHALLLQSIPESCHEQVLLELAAHEMALPTPPTLSAVPSVRSPRYRLVSLLPHHVAASKQFQYVVSHKLILRRPFVDLFFLRALTDALARASTSGGGDSADGKCEGDTEMTPLAAVFDAVVARWSQRAFVGTADYALNASVCFFIRYALTLLAPTRTFARDCQRRDWVAKLCQGVQSHLSHSLERMRVLGMRVGESLSRVLSPERPLDFELPSGDADALHVYGSAAFDGTAAAADDNSSDGVVGCAGVDATGLRGAAGQTAKAVKTRAKAKAAPFTLDPDQVLESDDDDDGTSSDGAGDDDGPDDSDSDSDVSLEAYDLNDDEQDLGAKRPVYLSDLVTALCAEDAREKTEAALAEAEVLLRRTPRDVHENSVAVVTALLRLEDKYDTQGFTAQRANALAAACVVSPQRVAPYLQRQALEREQLLQSRLDALQAMVAAAQELAQVGAFRPASVKSLLTEDRDVDVGLDLDARTIRALKTRRWGYRRDPLTAPKRNAFADHALAFFSPLLAGYVEYVRTHSRRSGDDRSGIDGLDADGGASGVSEVESVFLAHLLHALAAFVECAGHAPAAIPMATCLLEFAWRERVSRVAAVRRQVIFSLSRVLLVVPPFVLRQELGEHVAAMFAWLQSARRQDPDEGCREGARLLLASGALPMLSLS